jgi:hypothetical protein
VRNLIEEFLFLRFWYFALQARYLEK